MNVYRISGQKYSGALLPSGIEARWNKRGQKVIYASGSRSLACLENLVHRSAFDLKGIFRTLVIEIPGDLQVEELYETQLAKGWNHPDQAGRCREAGSAWFLSGRTAILRVPSALIMQEFNFVINTTHEDFKRIVLAGTEDFLFDPRIFSRK